MMIALSGIDSSGKSTQIDRVKTFLRHKKILVIWSRGGYTSFFSAVKSFMRFIKPTALPKPGNNFAREKAFNSSSIQKFWLFLAILDLFRLYVFGLRIYEALGYLVVCDRYLWDSYIDFKLKFPGVNFEKWPMWKLLCSLAMSPKSSIVLVISPEESLKRSMKKSEPFSESLLQRENRIKLYNCLANDGKWGHVIFAESGKDQVFEEIKSIIEGQFENK